MKTLDQILYDFFYDVDSDHGESILVDGIKRTKQDLIAYFLSLAPEEKEKDEYPKYCEDDGECYGECSKSRDYGFNQAIREYKANIEKA